MSEEEKQNATKHSHLSKNKSELPASQEQKDQSMGKEDPQHDQHPPPMPSTRDAKEKSEKAPAKERPARTPRNAKTEEKEPEEPSPNQPLLDQLLMDLKRDISEDAVQTSSINRKNGHLITLTIDSEHWLATANWFKEHPQWQCNYLRNLSGVDQESDLEVVYHLIGLTTKREVAIHVRADREAPSLPSVTPIWATANWNEREVYDLLGIHFTGHPNLSRIMMPDQWVGHPLRKDYEPIDSEV